MKIVTIENKKCGYPILDVVKCMWAGVTGKIGEKLRPPKHIKTVFDVWKEPLDPNCTTRTKLCS